MAQTSIDTSLRHTLIELRRVRVGDKDSIQLIMSMSMNVKRIKAKSSRGHTCNEISQKTMVRSEYLEIQLQYNPLQRGGEGVRGIRRRGRSGGKNQRKWHGSGKREKKKGIGKIRISS